MIIFCTKCGKQLVFAHEYRAVSFDGDTGKPVTDLCTVWSCPNREDYLDEFDSPHDKIVHKVRLEEA